MTGARWQAVMRKIPRDCHASPSGVCTPLRHAPSCVAKSRAGEQPGRVVAVAEVAAVQGQAGLFRTELSGPGPTWASSRPNPPPPVSGPSHTLVGDGQGASREPRPRKPSTPSNRLPIMIGRASDCIGAQTRLRIGQTPDSVSDPKPGEDHTKELLDFPQERPARSAQPGVALD